MEMDDRQADGDEFFPLLFSLSSPPARALCWPLALFILSALLLHCARMDTMSELPVSMQRCTRGIRSTVSVRVILLCGTLHQRSSAVGPPSSPRVCASSPFSSLPPFSCCLVVCTTCCVMKGHSSGKRGS